LRWPFGACCNGPDAVLSSAAGSNAPAIPNLSPQASVSFRLIGMPSTDRHVATAARGLTVAIWFEAPPAKLGPLQTGEESHRGLATRYAHWPQRCRAGCRCAVQGMPPMAPRRTPHSQFCFLDAANPLCKLPAKSCKSGVGSGTPAQALSPKARLRAATSDAL